MERLEVMIKCGHCGKESSLFHFATEQERERTLSTFTDLDYAIRSVILSQRYFYEEERVVKGILRFILVTVLFIACLIVFVVISYKLNWSWLGKVPGSSSFKPSALMLGDWITSHLLVVLIAFCAALVFVGLTGRRRTGHASKVHHHDHGGEIARRFGHERSPHWHRVAYEHLLREPACVACGHKGEGLQVHHIKPFHLHPHLELDPNNLITLCQIKGREHHLLLGHLDEWESYNEHIRRDARHYYRKSAAHIRADQEWQKKVLQRP